MPPNNQERVGQAMDALREALGPYLLRIYRQRFGTEDYLRAVQEMLTSVAYTPPDLPDEQTALLKIDVHGWLNLMVRPWNEMFRAQFGKAERSYIGELQDARNDWAHQKAFSDDEAHRIADTAFRLLTVIGASRQAERVRLIAQDLLRLRLESDHPAPRKTSRLGEKPLTTKAGLRPWRRVVKPHPDVASGHYAQAEFAADLAQVVQGRAAPEYGDPGEFFYRTYLTEGLLSLLVTAVRRLSGIGGDPVVQLQTSFGGGKTHSLLALYHLFGGQLGFDEIPGGEEILSRAGSLETRLVARRAVIVGTAFSASEPRDYGDVTTRTLWGEIAYQLGGVEGYRMLETADQAGISPGADTLLRLLETYGPALIIVDELVAFARNLYSAGETRLPAGTFGTLITFVQALSEAVRRARGAMLVVAIPESAIEVGGESGKVALETLAKTIGRVEAVWKPVSAAESFEIVRRRLFSAEMDYPARDAALTAFAEMYTEHAAEFPPGVAEGDYRRQMKAAYPFHPELFARLYEDWSTLERFQRTRGVLRLMAAVVHRLWQEGDSSLLILPGTLPLADPAVRDELTRYLPENWPAILDNDIDSENAKAAQIDKLMPMLGQYAAGRRAARAIFMGSAPATTSQAGRGLTAARIRLACVQPGEPPALFGDALRHMASQLTYLFSAEGRYWFDTRPTLNRIAQDRAQQIGADILYAAAIEQLRSVRWRREDFAAVHLAPGDTADVPDEMRLRMVVLDPGSSHSRYSAPSRAQDVAAEILERRGSAPRLYRNMLIFAAPDAEALTAWDRALREWLAWRSIRDDAQALNLDMQQIRRAEENSLQAETSARLRLQEAYCWVIVPMQDPPGGEFRFEALRITGPDTFYERAMRRLRQDDLVIVRWSPGSLRELLDRWLWQGFPHLEIRQLWEYLARYCYLPRLAGPQTLHETIAEGVALPDAPFAYAAGAGPDGSYHGLLLNRPVGTLSEQAVIVRPEVAEAYLAANPPVGWGRVALTTPEPREIVEPLGEAPVTRFTGRTALDPGTAEAKIARIVAEIVARLAAQPGTQIEMELTIRAVREAGFEAALARTIERLARDLGFEEQRFEGEDS